MLQALSNRDMRGLDEKTIKLLLMTYASLGRAFYPLSEKEFAQGYGDLFLGASRDISSAPRATLPAPSIHGSAKPAKRGKKPRAS